MLRRLTRVAGPQRSYLAHLRRMKRRALPHLVTPSRPPRALVASKQVEPAHIAIGPFERDIGFVGLARVLAFRCLDTIMAKDCAACFWVYGPRLPDTLKVLEGWGFTFKSELFVWVKITKKGRTAAYRAGPDHTEILRDGVAGDARQGATVP